MRKSLLLFVFAAALSACGLDRGRCIVDHVEHEEATFVPQPVIVPGPNGSITTTIVMQYEPEHDVTVCDRWEFPNGRPQAER